MNHGRFRQVLTVVTSSNSRFRQIERRAAQAAEWLQDLIFPPTCGHCGRVDFRFCPACLRELEQAPMALSQMRVESLDALRATGGHHGVIQNAVHAFKYDDARELAAPLADRLFKALRLLNLPIDALVPVPLFADRHAERGYNQSELLCQQLALKTGIPARPTVIERIRQTSQQATLSGFERQDNVKDAFAASADVMGLSVLLVDDVATSGSTLRECAKALRQQAAGPICGIAVSHSLSSDWVPQEEYDEYQHSWRWDQDFGGA